MNAVAASECPSVSMDTVASLRATLSEREKELRRLEGEIALIMCALGDIVALLRALVKLDGETKRQAVDRNQSAVNALGASRVLAAIRGARR